jgi:quinate dehydrogenase
LNCLQKFDIMAKSQHAANDWGESTIGPDYKTVPRSLYLFGYPVKSSLAAIFHERVFQALQLPWKFHLQDAHTVAEALEYMRRDDFAGASVTMPLKGAFMAEMDELTPAATVMGAMNTIAVRLGRDGQRRYIGTNTDYIGVKDSLLKHHPHLAGAGGRAAVVVGGGGAARASVYALLECMSLGTVYLVNREPSEASSLISDFAKAGYGERLRHVQDASEVQSLEPPLIIVGAVPDFPPTTPEETRAHETVEAFLRTRVEGAVALDLCYHPHLWTSFLESAQAKGWKTVLGSEMMIYQAVDQDLCWTQRPVEEIPIEEAGDLVRNAISGK